MSENKHIERLFEVAFTQVNTQLGEDIGQLLLEHQALKDGMRSEMGARHTIQRMLGSSQSLAREMALKLEAETKERQESEKMRQGLINSITEFRDAVLHGLDQFSSEDTNAVLGCLDSYVSLHEKPEMAWQVLPIDPALTSHACKCCQCGNLFWSSKETDCLCDKCIVF